jgi:integrase
MSEILVNQTRVLTPDEVSKITEQMGGSHSILFLAQLYTGMRYEEFKRFCNHPEWYDKDRKLIRLTRDAIRKQKVVQKERSVILSNPGNFVISHMIKERRNIYVPARASWNESLKHYAKKAGINPAGISGKMLRKTWESWLFTTRPQMAHIILSSQGHTSGICIGHYLGLGFTSAEKVEIEKHITGWGE